MELPKEDSKDTCTFVKIGNEWLMIVDDHEITFNGDFNKEYLEKKYSMFGYDIVTIIAKNSENGKGIQKLVTRRY